MSRLQLPCLISAFDKPSNIKTSEAPERTIERLTILFVEHEVPLLVLAASLPCPLIDLLLLVQEIEVVFRRTPRQRLFLRSFRHLFAH